MFNYLGRRTALAVFTVWLAVTFAFTALHALPGDAIEAQLTQSGATPAQINARRAALGLDKPLIEQYETMLTGLLRGDFGTSLSGDRPVSAILGEQFGATAQLTAAALVLAIVLGVALGLLSALGRSGIIRGMAVGGVALALAAPVYWTGTLAIYVFSVWLKALPSSGGGDLRHLILPAGTLGLAVSGGIARVTAANVRDVAGADFVRTARAKGLRRWQIVYRHILRASWPPILSMIALQGGFLLGGTAIVEALFVRQGIGQVLLNAINTHDYPVVQGAVVIGALAYSLLNAAADLINAAIDPRLRSAPTWNE